MKNIVSVIIPSYNESRYLGDCINSLLEQQYTPLEIIIIDDGSRDKSQSLIELFKKTAKIPILSVYQKHSGPARARNNGAIKARGEILVFVDADMVFDKNFISDLVNPIFERAVKGTFSKEEYLLNKDNILSVCWNINRYLINGWKLDGQEKERLLPVNYPDKQTVFRAILKCEFEKVGGFDDVGYTDDWTLSDKLGYLAQSVDGAKYYHRNPQNLGEVYTQAKWIGGNKFLTGSIVRRLLNLIRYNLLFSLYYGLKIGIIKTNWYFMVFKLVYDFGITVFVLKSFRSSIRIK